MLELYNPRAQMSARYRTNRRMVMDIYDGADWTETDVETSNGHLTHHERIRIGPPQAKERSMTATLKMTALPMASAGRFSPLGFDDPSDFHREFQAVSLRFSRRPIGHSSDRASGRNDRRQIRKALFRRIIYGEGNFPHFDAPLLSAKHSRGAGTARPRQSQRGRARGFRGAK
jgi:hypothetical protein